MGSSLLQLCALLACAASLLDSASSLRSHVTDREDSNTKHVPLRMHPYPLGMMRTHRYPLPFPQPVFIPMPRPYKTMVPLRVPMTMEKRFPMMEHPYPMYRPVRMPVHVVRPYRVPFNTPHPVPMRVNQPFRVPVKVGEKSMFFEPTRYEMVRHGFYPSTQFKETNFAEDSPRFVEETHIAADVSSTAADATSFSEDEAISSSFSESTTESPATVENALEQKASGSDPADIVLLPQVSNELGSGTESVLMTEDDIKTHLTRPAHGEPEDLKRPVYVHEKVETLETAQSEPLVSEGKGDLETSADSIVKKVTEQKLIK